MATTTETALAQIAQQMTALLARVDEVAVHVDTVVAAVREEIAGHPAQLLDWVDARVVSCEQETGRVSAELHDLRERLADA